MSKCRPFSILGRVQVPSIRKVRSCLSADHDPISLVSCPRCSVFGPWTSSFRTYTLIPMMISDTGSCLSAGHTFTIISSSSRVSSCSHPSRITGGVLHRGPDAPGGFHRRSRGSTGGAGGVRGISASFRGESHIGRVMNQNGAMSSTSFVNGESHVMSQSP